MEQEHPEHPSDKKEEWISLRFTRDKEEAKRLGLRYHIEGWCMKADDANQNSSETGWDTKS